MSEQDFNFTIIRKHVFGNQIYESTSKVIPESIVEDNQVVTKRDLSIYWNSTIEDDKTILTTEFPIAATEQTTWSDFWNRYVIYTSATSSGTKEGSITLTASDFVYVDYLGPTNNKKVYACSPSKGLYTMTPTGNTITAEQVLAQGCVHVNYSTNQDRFLICSDNRTSLGTACALIIWDGSTNTKVLQYNAYSTNVPFNISAYGILYYSGSTRIYGFYLGGATYNGEHNKTGFGSFYLYENDLQNSSITIYRNSGYSYLNGDGDTSTPDNSQYDSNRFVSADIKCIKFSNPSNSVWVVATDGNTCGSFSNWGEDVLISQVGSDSVGKFYRFRFRTANNKQKVAKILFSANSTWNHNGTTGTGIGIVCCYDNNIPVYWFPSDFHPESEKNTIASSSSFKIPSCTLGSGANNNQWLSCIDTANYVLIGGSSKICYMPLAQSNASSNPNPLNMSRTLTAIPNNPYSTYGHYLDMTAVNDDVYVCANGAVIQIKGVNSISDISTLTTDSYVATEIKDDNNNSIQLVSVTNDGEYIYAVGTSSGSGKAVIIKPDGGGGVISDSIITTSEFSKLKICPTIHRWYSTLGQCLTTIKTNKETNPSGIVPGSSKTWLQAYNSLMSSGDADIINFLNGTDDTFANCGPD